PAGNADAVRTAAILRERLFEPADLRPVGELARLDQLDDVTGDRTRQPRVGRPQVDEGDIGGRERTGRAVVRGVVLLEEALLQGDRNCVRARAGVELAEHMVDVRLDRLTRQEETA